jgi:hypothetical protein
MPAREVTHSRDFRLEVGIGPAAHPEKPVVQMPVNNISYRGHTRPPHKLYLPLSLDEAFARVYRSLPLGNPDKLRRLLCSGKL